MKKLFRFPFLIAILFCMMASYHHTGVDAAELSEGTYHVDYILLQPDNNSVSIANDYFEKPATVTIENGKQYVKFTLNQSEWIKSLKSANGDVSEDVQILNEDVENNRRDVAFLVDEDISEPLLLQMHVVIEEMEPKYDHNYSVRLEFDLDSMEITDEPAVVLPISDSEKGDQQKVFVYVLIVGMVLIVLIAVRILSSSKKKK